MKDRVSQGMYLIATVLALVAFTILDTVVAWIDDTALHASDHATVRLVEHVIKTTVIVRKALIKLLDRKSHI